METTAAMKAMTPGRLNSPERRVLIAVLRMDRPAAISSTATMAVAMISAPPWP